MPRRKKYAQYNTQGCKICGQPIGRGIDRHVEGHGIRYQDYRQCFESGQIIFDELKDTGKVTRKGKRRVFLHVLIRRFEV